MTAGLPIHALELAQRNRDDRHVGLFQTILGDRLECHPIAEHTACLVDGQGIPPDDVPPLTHQPEREIERERSLDDRCPWFVREPEQTDGFPGRRPFEDLAQHESGVLVIERVDGTGNVDTAPIMSMNAESA
jgi:hypothetical protein